MNVAFLRSTCEFEWLVTGIVNFLCYIEHDYEEIEGEGGDEQYKAHKNVHDYVLRFTARHR